MAQWLSKLHPDIKNSSHRALLKRLLLSKKWATLQWLLDVCPGVDIHENNDQLFDEASHQGNWDAASWLIEKGVVPCEGHFLRPKYFLRVFRSVVHLIAFARKTACVL